MKILTLCVCSIALAISAVAQPPPPPPPGPSATVSATATASVSPGSLADKIHQKLEKKLHGRHGIVIDGDRDLGEIKSDDLPEFVIPIVAITMLTIFGAPVLIVALIMYFGFSKNRAQNSPSVTSLPSVRSTAFWLTVPPRSSIWRIRVANGTPDPRTVAKRSYVADFL